jgi:cyclopropane fatty-acyl-phospholipid synthase-like methyltransferase
MPDKNNRTHWNSVYVKSPIEKLGWYEEDPEPSLRLIEKCNLNMNDIILNVGTGTSTLIDELLKKGYENIIANDLSSQALETLKSRLGKKNNEVRWIVDDLTQPNELAKLEPIDLWHDRAVLHFFTNEKDRKIYFALLNKLVKANGYVIIAAFNLQGAEKCSGLPVFRYNANMLLNALGSSFEMIESFNYTYTMPSGDTREYIYTLFRKNC